MEKTAHTVLCIDDEPNILNALKRLLRKENFRLLTGCSGAEGLEILAENKAHIVISDQRMPGMNGTEFLKKVKEAYPDIIRIILTGYTDVDSISEAINEGHIYKFFLKPWNDQNLKLEVRQALEQYDLIRDNKYLLDQVVQQNEELKTINENLEMIVRERTQSLEVQNQALQISHAILEDLPLPILGISSELMVAMVNRAARDFWEAEVPIQLGGGLSDYFGKSVINQVAQCLTKNEKIRGTAYNLNDRKIDIELIPLSGRFREQGVIMTFSPCRDE